MMRAAAWSVRAAARWTRRVLCHLGTYSMAIRVPHDCLAVERILMGQSVEQQGGEFRLKGVTTRLGISAFRLKAKWLLSFSTAPSQSLFSVDFWGLRDSAIFFTRTRPVQSPLCAKASVQDGRQVNQ
jgi:hypothetical protein